MDPTCQPPVQVMETRRDLSLFKKTGAVDVAIWGCERAGKGEVCEKYSSLARNIARTLLIIRTAQRKCVLIFHVSGLGERGVGGRGGQLFADVPADHGFGIGAKERDLLLYVLIVAKTNTMIELLRYFQCGEGAPSPQHEGEMKGSGQLVIAEEAPKVGAWFSRERKRASDLAIALSVKSREAAVGRGRCAGAGS